jgi:hypothetical protein
MCLLSIGYEKRYERVFALTGLFLGSFTFLYLRAEDKQRMWRRKAISEEDVNGEILQEDKRRWTKVSAR